MGVGCSSPRRRRTPGHSYPASRLRPGGHLALLGHEVGPRAREPLPATATGARPDARAAPGPVAPLGLRLGASVGHCTDPRRPEACPGKARASGGPTSYPFSRDGPQEPPSGPASGARGQAGLRAPPSPPPGPTRDRQAPAPAPQGGAPPPGGPCQARAPHRAPPAAALSRLPRRGRGSRALPAYPALTRLTCRP